MSEVTHTVDDHGFDVYRTENKGYVVGTLSSALAIVKARAEGKWDKSASDSKPDDTALKNRTSARWDDNTNLSAAIEYANNGWSKGQKALDNLSGEIPALASERSSKRRSRYSASTGTPSVGRYLSGNPRYRRHRVRVSHPIIDICVPIGALSEWSAEELKNRGLAICALIEKLERDGNGVSLSCYHTSSYNNKIEGYELSLKKAGSTTDKDLIMFALAHPAFMRRIGFCIKEYYFPDMTHRGYGATVYDTKRVTETAALSSPSESKIYLANMGQKRNFSTAQKAFDFVCENIDKITNKKAA